MGNHIDEVVRITLDSKVKPPPAIDTGLPDIIGLIVFLGPERRVAEVLHQQSNAAVKGPLNGTRGVRVAAEKTLGVVEMH